MEPSGDAFKEARVFLRRESIGDLVGELDGKLFEKTGDGADLVGVASREIVHAGAPIDTARGDGAVLADGRLVAAMGKSAENGGGVETMLDVAQTEVETVVVADEVAAGVEVAGGGDGEFFGKGGATVAVVKSVVKERLDFAFNPSDGKILSEAPGVDVVAGDFAIGIPESQK